MPDYDSRTAREARALERRANALFLEGQRANRISDDYVKVTVILAAALFFGGIGQVFRTLPVRLVLLGVAAANMIWGVIVMMGLPVN